MFESPPIHTHTHTHTHTLSSLRPLCFARYSIVCLKGCHRDLRHRVLICWEKAGVFVCFFIAQNSGEPWQSSSDMFPCWGQRWHLCVCPLGPRAALFMSIQEKNRLNSYRIKKANSLRRIRTHIFLCWMTQNKVSFSSSYSVSARWGLKPGLLSINSRCHIVLKKKKRGLLIWKGPKIWFFFNPIRACAAGSYSHKRSSAEKRTLECCRNHLFVSILDGLGHGL